MAGWHHGLDGCELEWTPGVGDGGLACCNSWSHKESDTTEWLNWTELIACEINQLPRFLGPLWLWWAADQLPSHVRFPELWHCSPAGLVPLPLTSQDLTQCNCTSETCWEDFLTYLVRLDKILPSTIPALYHNSLWILFITNLLKLFVSLFSCF